MNESTSPISSPRVAFAAIVLAMLPAVLDQTILATALPTIAHDLGRLTDVSWVIAAYVVTAAATTPLWGKLGDRLGRKRMLQVSLAMFLAASAVCGVVQDMTWLIVSRGVQGAAAGGLMSLAMAAVGDLVSPRERGRYQGYIAIAFALATVVGPLIGGVLVEHASWRWVFYVNLPVGAVALAGLYFKLPAPEPARQRAKHLDLAGAGLLAGSTIALMLACIWGGDRYPWGSATIIALIAGGAALAVALVARERRVADPIVPLTLLRLRPVAVSSVALFLTTAALFSITVFVPLYLQTTTHATPTQAGLLLVPMMIGITVSTNLAGLAMSKTGRYKRYPVLGLGFMTVALVLLAALVPHPSRTTTAIGLVVFGLGFGMVGQVLIAAVQNSVPRADLGVAMATTSFFRGLGGAVGAAALGAIFTARTGV
ncbi:MAG: MDR family MFS transporter, partial [Solirubrobacteraceae bacterium]